MTLSEIEQELKLFHSFQYKWGRRQSDDWDHQTKFIYKVFKFEQLIANCAELPDNLSNYAKIRWYNFWSAKAVEAIFSLHPSVEPNINKYDKLSDFKLCGISFDHKTIVFPKGFNRDIIFAKRHPNALINWLYENQSQQGRKHFGNRLFLVLYANNGLHWQLKAEISKIKKHVDNYLNDFNINKLVRLNIHNKKILSDVLFIDNMV